jgi:hypothetical protein
VCRTLSASWRTLQVPRQARALKYSIMLSSSSVTLAARCTKTIQQVTCQGCE